MKTNDEIIVFTIPTCPHCHMAKGYLKDKKVSFKEVDVSKDYTMAQKMVQKSGQMGVPQIWIKGQVIMGFNKEHIDMLLGL
ncbi:NrdH-redoxin [Candidatus Roizmanbacteria bacterium]|nr:NrdH-redoxin [Candidatus Roizmanbacteria bacterium]